MRDQIEYAWASHSAKNIHVNEFNSLLAKSLSDSEEDYSRLTLETREAPTPEHLYFWLDPLCLGNIQMAAFTSLHLCWMIHLLGQSSWKTCETA